MRSFVIAILLFCVVTIVIILNSLYITSICEELMAYAQDIEASKRTPSEIDRLWQKNRRLFGISISEAKTERMDELIISLFAAHGEQNTYEKARICKLIVALAKDIAVNERVSLDGIF